MNGAIITLIMLIFFLIVVIVIGVAEYVEKIRMERDIKRMNFITKHPKTKIDKNGKVTIEK